MLVLGENSPEKTKKGIDFCLSACYNKQALKIEGNRNH